MKLERFSFRKTYTNSLIGKKKACSNCNHNYDLSHFYKSKISKDGYRASCKSCSKISNVKSAQKNNPSGLERSRDYVLSNITKHKTLEDI